MIPVNTEKTAHDKFVALYLATNFALPLHSGGDTIMDDNAPCDGPRTDRGEIVSITMKIQYPDGQTKTVTYDEDWCFETGAILIAESCMTGEQKAQFHKSDDWRENPTFLKWERGHKRCGSDCVGGGTCTDCCACTSCPK